MSSMTFDPATRPDLKDRIAGMTVRDGEGHLHRMGQHYWQEPVKYSGGGGCWGSCNDYIKLLTSLLRKDGKILKSQTIELMFQGHLKDPSYLTKVHQNPALHALAGNIPQGTRLDHGLGGILNMDEVSTTGRAPYTMQWSGLPNLFWWINPQDGVAGCYFGQLVPPGDEASLKMFEKFEAAVYKFIGKSVKQEMKL
ncbi:hypothetical protein LTS18_001334 [Coniosporium uncinatum]|uniref:Uncharacterized protein n=1 Tax=Coniosporium uncinatum TaxID=93489 RepID=A0ACC3DV94_9PEZI|nr:hypothetical protein LTS18_001334 [Coniosporium uncinatum]